MLKYLRLLFLVGFRLLATFIFYINRYARHPGKYPFEVRYNRIRKLVLKIWKAFRIDYHVTGFDKYVNYDKKCVIISNHLSDSDPLIYIALSEKPITFVAKKEAFTYPFVGTCLRALEALPLDRENLRNQVDTLQRAIDIAKNGIPNVIIFAEGTRNRHPGTKTLEFKAGSSKVPLRADVVCFPGALYGTFRIFSSKINLKSYPVFVDILEMITPEEIAMMNTVKTAEKMRSLVDLAIEKNKPIDYEIISKMKLSKKKKEKLLACDLIKIN